MRLDLSLMRLGLGSLRTLEVTESWTSCLLPRHGGSSDASNHSQRRYA